MIKIRSLRPGDLKQVLSLLNRYVERESEYAVLQKLKQLYIPLHRVSRLLPPTLQFMPAIFVAMAHRKVLGLIWLNRDGRQARRWKIDHLILDPDSFSYDVGTQLVHYVINRYGGEGVQTFLAYVDQYYDTGLALLKSCGFRRCTRMHYFSHMNPSTLKLTPVTLEGVRESTTTDHDKLAVLFNETLPPEARVCLAKNGGDFRRSCLQSGGERMKGWFFKRWVVSDVARDCLIASVEISTANYQDFYLNLVAHASRESMYHNILVYAIQQVLLMTGNSKIYVDCYEFCRQGVGALEQLGFHRDSIAEVLVKDYWIPIEDKGIRLQSPILVFSGKTSPATMTMLGKPRSRY